MRCLRFLALAAVVAAAPGTHAAGPTAAERATDEGSAVARIAGDEVRCSVREAKGTQACARKLLALLRSRAEEGFIVAHELRATEDEIAELEAYQRTFRAHDRGQRARKLRDLDQRLAAGAPSGDIARLQEFRRVLIRLARYEADVDAGIEQQPVLPTEVLRSWIESSKLDRALYELYGGVVGLTAAGQYAHGARAALVIEYTASHGVEFLDPEVEQRFHAALAAPPPLIFSGTRPDFTPFWKRPIPPSYVAD